MPGSFTQGGEGKAGYTSPSMPHSCPLPTSSRMAETNSPAHFSFLSTHYTSCGILYFNHTSLPTFPQTQRYLDIFLRPCLCSSHALSLELPALIPCLSNPTPPLVLSSQASLQGGLLPPERSLARWHSSLLGPDGILPWWSVGCPPICLPSLPPEGRSVLRARPTMIELTSVAALRTAQQMVQCPAAHRRSTCVLLEHTSQFHARLQQQTNTPDTTEDGSL